MSCKHGNSMSGCDLCEEEDAAYAAGFEAGQQSVQRQPLTDEEIYGMYSEPRSDAELVEFAREIERAHGIGGNDE